MNNSIVEDFGIIVVFVLKNLMQNKLQTKGLGIVKHAIMM